MTIIKHTDGTITLIPTLEERAVIDWLDSISSSKFKLFLEEYLKQRGINKQAADDRDLLQAIKSMPDEEQRSLVARARGLKNG